MVLTDAALVIRSQLIADPNPQQRTNSAAQQPPHPQPIAVVGQRTEPAAGRAADTDAEIYQLFHTASVSDATQTLFRLRPSDWLRAAGLWR